jgi:hypothetical protein
MDDKSIETRKIRVEELLGHVHDGKFAIPKLQREFVWDGKKAAKLLDSIVSGIPIGVPMIWNTPRSQRLHLREKYHVLPPFNKRNGRVWFIIDGQQRVSVLHHVQQGDLLENGRLKPVDFGRVVLATGKAEAGKRVSYRNPVDGEYVSFRQVLDPHWFKRLRSLGKQKLKRIRYYRQRLLNYPIYFMFIHGTLDEVTECFLRVNTLGMKVTTADAIISGAQELDLRDFTHEVRARIAEPSFKSIPEMPILFALVATQGGTEARGRALQTRVRRLESEASQSPKRRAKLERDWTRLASCFGKAVDYLQREFRVISRDFLGYDYMISMLALFYFWNGHGPSEYQKREIQKWFWATCVGQRYSGGEFLRCLPADTKFFKKVAEHPRTRFRFRPLKDRTDLVRTQYGGRTGIGSGVYCLLLKRGPVSINDDGLNAIPLWRYATRANRKDRHHIFPRALMSRLEESPSRYNSIVNICLLTAEENQQIGNRQPRSYLGDAKANTRFFGKKMSRHLIPCEDVSAVWVRNPSRAFRRFLTERADLLCKEFENEAGIRLFRRDRRA